MMDSFIFSMAIISILFLLGVLIFINSYDGDSDNL